MDCPLVQVENMYASFQRTKRSPDPGYPLSKQPYTTPGSPSCATQGCSLQAHTSWVPLSTSNLVALFTTSTQSCKKCLHLQLQLSKIICTPCHIYHHFPTPLFTPTPFLPSFLLSYLLCQTHLSVRETPATPPAIFTVQFLTFSFA